MGHKRFSKTLYGIADLGIHYYGCSSSPEYSILNSNPVSSRRTSTVCKNYMTRGLGYRPEFNVELVVVQRESNCFTVADGADDTKF